MKKTLFWKKQVSSSDYSSRSPNYYLKAIEPDILESFNSEQLQAITDILTQAIPKPAPKIVDLKFRVDLIFSRFYIVLFVGKDLRKEQRQHEAYGISKIGNLAAVVILLLGTNLVISALILLFAYLFKSAIGIDFFPGHISETLKKI
jgi:hypothetical protein